MAEEKRYTIGMLRGSHLYEGSVPNPFVHAVLRGIQKAAQDHDVNLLAACGLTRGPGRSRHHPAWPELSQESDFVPVGPWNTDGLIIMAPPRSIARLQYARTLIEREFPVLFIGDGFGSPTIMVDNERGIRQMIEHLVGHGHRRIAFIAGEEQDSSDGLARLTAYRNGMQELGLETDPRLIAHGQNWDVGGQSAMQRILDSGAPFTAVMCTNDASAVGAMRALRASGRRIPWDVAVTGFDDHLSALAQVPPLTSVHYPMFETGYRSLLLLLERIESGLDAIPQVVRVGTWIVPRQSCGCLPDAVASPITVQPDVPPDENQNPDRFPNGISRAMVEALRTNSAAADGGVYPHLCDRLTAGFLQSLEDDDSSHFQMALFEVIQRVELTPEDDPHLWQRAITALRLGAQAVVRKGRARRRAERAEDLLHQARTLLSESAMRRYIRLQVEQMVHDEAMGRLTARLLSSQEEAQMYGILAEYLPQTGIGSCHIAYFEAQEDDPIAGSRVLASESGAPELHFETRAFPPPGLYPANTPFSLVLLPLFFQEENLGYVAFDGTELGLLATVVRQLASAIMSARLHEQVVELSLTDGLTGLHNRRYFDLMLKKETDRSRRYNRDLAVIMVDIDQFKTYNDAFGHPAGDLALQEVARRIALGARRGLDIVTRYGGEEFAIILPETDSEGARIVAENIRKQMAQSGNFLRPTTVSLGIGARRGTALLAQELVERADRALYQAKHHGRDRAMTFEEGMPEAAHGTPDAQTDGSADEK